MIRATAVPRPVRVGIATASVVGVAVLAGCSAGAAEAGSETAAATPTAEATASTGTETTEASAPADSDSAYVDGTYTAEGSYQTPESVETISVTVTLEDDIVTAVQVTGNPTKRESEQYQSEFIGGISDEVVGKSIDDLSVSRVAGSSLTSGGFNEAIDQIKLDAAA